MFRLELLLIIIIYLIISIAYLKLVIKSIDDIYKCIKPNNPLFIKVEDFNNILLYAIKRFINKRINVKN